MFMPTIWQVRIVFYTFMCVTHAKSKNTVLVGGYTSATMARLLDDVFRDKKVPNARLTGMDIIFLGEFFCLTHTAKIKYNFCN